MPRAPRLLLGVLAFLVDAIPVAVIVGLFLPGTTPDWLATAGLLAFLIAAGLHIPMYLILGAVAGDRAAPRRWLEHPFSLFAFWWRHIR